MRTNGSFPALVFMVIAGAGALLGFDLHAAGQDYLAFISFGLAIFLAAITSAAIRVADQWSKAVVLRLGKFRALQGPGLFFIIPLIDTIPYWIDTRVLTSSFKAEKTLTKIPSLWMSMQCCFGRSWTRRRQPLLSRTTRARLAGPLRPPFVT